MKSVKKIHSKIKETSERASGLYREDKKRFFKILFAAIAVVALAAVAYSRVPREMTMKQAGKIGEKKTYQLLIKIDNSRGNGGFERGDIILTAAEDKQFSVAEQEGFLIIKMGLTQEQANLLLRQKGEGKRLAEDGGDPGEREQAAQEPLRRFRVDLQKLGIADTEVKGRVIGDKVWDWQEVVKEK